MIKINESEDGKESKGRMNEGEERRETSMKRGRLVDGEERGMNTYSGRE